MNSPEIVPQHYAFAVADAEFDEIMKRITVGKVTHGLSNDEQGLIWIVTTSVAGGGVMLYLGCAGVLASRQR
jgi:hypothetical protein